MVGLSLSAAAAPSPADAPPDGNKILAGLKSIERIANGGKPKPEDIFESGLAMGYIGGIYDSDNGAIVCAPSNVTRGQVQDIFFKFLQASPEVRHQPAHLLLAGLLRQAFPCPKK